MSKKKKLFTGVIDSIPKNEIVLNVNELKDGEYILKIIHKNKVIKQTTFKK